MPQEYILKENGAVVARNIEETPITVTPQMLQCLTDKLKRHVPCAFPLPPENLQVGLCVMGQNSVSATMRLKTLLFNAPFKLEDKVLFPAFQSSGSPVMTLEWTPPSSMFLYFLARLQDSGGQWRSIKTWLFALSEGGSAWRLPVSNLYEDCSLCTGDVNTTSWTLGESLAKIYTQFRKAQWNKDLAYESYKTSRLFRWKAETNPFEQLPIDAPNWTNLCAKVSSPAMEEICR